MVEELAAHPRALAGEELREELEGLVEEFLSQFAATYAEFISTCDGDKLLRGIPKRAAVSGRSWQQGGLALKKRRLRSMPCKVAIPRPPERVARANRTHGELW